MSDSVFFYQWFYFMFLNLGFFPKQILQMSIICLSFKVPEFRNFKAVPTRDKDIPDNVFQV